jgi:hypothetical protein
LLRLLICTALLGGLYLLVFGWPKTATRPLNDTQKLADVRAALDETYVATQQLNGFHVIDATASDQLNSQVGQFNHAVDHLKQALAAAPTSLPPETRSTVDSLLKRDKAAADAYTAHYQPFAQVIEYNPAADLPAVNSSTTKSVAERATAAKKGLTKAADNQLVTPDIRQALQLEADCFDRLAKTTTADQRNQCVSAYPALRLQIIQSAIRPAWGDDYAAYVKQTVPPLLKRLDSLVRAQS